MFDPFGTNGVGAATNLALSGALQAAGAGGTFGTLVRANNMVAYVLPGGTQGTGLYGQLQVAAGENSAGQQVLGRPYRLCRRSVRHRCVLWQHRSRRLPTTYDLDVWNIGGSWNFGFMKLSGFFGEISTEASLAPMLGRQNWYVGVAAPFGQWNLKASYGGTNGKDSLDGIDATQWAIGVDYNLSKRTALYATWSSINNDNGANFRVSTQSSGLASGGNSTGGQIGVRHSF